MGKRSDLPRVPKDKYYTWDIRAYDRMRTIFGEIKTFIEPCAGGGDLIRNVELLGPVCNYACDIEPTDDLEATDGGIWRHSYELIPDKVIELSDYIITNPPWTRSIMHPFIDWCITSGKPAWLLLDANWAITKQARPYLAYCSDIVPTARLKWIPDTDDSAKDDTAWFRFQAEPCLTIWRNSELRPRNHADGLL